MASKIRQELWTEGQIKEYMYENVWHSIFAKDVWLQRFSVAGEVIAFIMAAGSCLACLWVKYSLHSCGVDREAPKIFS
jgi:hypothetical protein